MSKFSETLVEQAQPILQAVISHPFLQEIITGEISNDALITYVQQDEYYLGEYAKAFANAYLLANNDAQRVLVAPSITTEAEIVAHEWLLEHAGTTLAEVGLAKPNPNTVAYLNHIKASGAHNYFYQITAVLPCMWIYREFGRNLGPKVGTNTLLGKWMHLYANDMPEYFEMSIVDDLFAMLDTHIDELSAHDQANLIEIFLRGCEYEYHFFDAAYRQQKWLYEA